MAIPVLPMKWYSQGIVRKREKNMIKTNGINRRFVEKFSIENDDEDRKNGVIYKYEEKDYNGDTYFTYRSRGYGKKNRTFSLEEFLKFKTMRNYYGGVAINEKNLINRYMLDYFNLLDGDDVDQLYNFCIVEIGHYTISSEGLKHVDRKQAFVYLMVRGWMQSHGFVKKNVLEALDGDDLNKVQEMYPKSFFIITYCAPTKKEATKWFNELRWTSDDLEYFPDSIEHVKRTIPW